MSELTKSQQEILDVLHFATAWFYVALMIVVIISIIAYTNGIRWSWVIPKFDDSYVTFIKILKSVGK